jgi:hypothetical protein
MRTMRRAAWISALAALAWLPQAWVLALLLGDALGGRFDRTAGLVGPLSCLGLLRAALRRCRGALFRAGEAVVAEARARLIAQEVRRGPGEVAGPGAVAALAAEKLDLLLPYVARYAPARARAMLLPAAILGAAFSASWAVGLVLLISGPLIPVFQALIGIAAKAGQQAPAGRGRRAERSAGGSVVGADRGAAARCRGRVGRGFRRRIGQPAPAHHGGAAGCLPVLDGSGAVSPRSAWQWWRSGAASRCWG